MLTPTPPPSLWLRRAARTEELDTVVVGAGIVGLSTAYWLAREGAAAVVLEAEHVAAKASGRNAGFLLTGSAEPLTRLARVVGLERAVHFWEVSRENRELLRRELLDPGVVEAAFQPEGSFLAALDGTDQAEHLEESGALLRERGFEVEWWGRRRVAEASGSGRLAGALFQPRDGGLDPVQLCRGLARLGRFEVRAGVAVRAIAGAGDQVRLSTTAGEILARRVVLAMNAYLPFLVPSLAAVVRPVRGQALATAPGPRRLAGVWYVDDGYQYLRQLPNGTLVLGGCRRVAERVEVGYAETPTGTVQGALETFLAETFPGLAGRPIVDRWAGIMGFSADGFPVLGELPHLGPVVYAAGFSGHGLSLGFVTGRHLARRVLGQQPGELF